MKKFLPIVFCLISHISYLTSFCQSKSKIVLKDKTVLKDVKIHNIYFNKVEYEQAGSMHDLPNSNIEHIETENAILSFDENGNTLSRPYDYIIKVTNDTIFCIISQLGGNYIYYYAKGKENRSYLSASTVKDYRKFEPLPIQKKEEKTEQVLQPPADTAQDKKGNSVQTDTSEKVNEDPPVYTIVEEMPAFPGGEQELFKYLSQNIIYPAMAKDAGISGIVYVTFVVMEDGKINYVKVLKGVGGGCDEEAMRVVKNMPEWKAGKQRGKSVRVQFNLPIKFTLKGSGTDTISKKEVAEKQPVSVGVDGKKIEEKKTEVFYEESYEEPEQSDQILQQSIKNDLCYESYMKGTQDAAQKDEIIWAFAGFCANGCFGIPTSALTYWAQEKDEPVLIIPAGVEEKCYILGFQNQKKENRVQNVAIGGMAAVVIFFAGLLYIVAVSP